MASAGGAWVEDAGAAERAVGLVGRLPLEADIPDWAARKGVKAWVTW